MCGCGGGSLLARVDCLRLSADVLVLRASMREHLNAKLIVADREVHKAVLVVIPVLVRSTLRCNAATTPCNDPRDAEILHRVAGRARHVELLDVRVASDEQVEVGSLFDLVPIGSL